MDRDTNSDHEHQGGNVDDRGVTVTVPSAGVLTQAALRFGIDPDGLTFVRDSANIVYEFSRNGRDFVLRLSPSAGKSRNLIYSEMAWIDYLAARGGQVATPVRSREGKLVERLSGGERTFWAVAFEKAPGVHPEGDLLTDDLLRAWGAALGRMHRLGREYAPTDPYLRRPHWHELDAFQLAERIPASQPIVQERWREMRRYLAGLPTDPQGYGLIHADPEPWNLLLHEDEVTFIDFDESCYCWYAFDLAVSITYAVLARGAADADAFGQRAWDQLYSGYAREHSLSRFWLEKMPALLQFRLMQDYVFHLGLWQAGHEEDWLAQLLHQQRRTIERNMPVLDIAFSEASGAERG